MIKSQLKCAICNGDFLGIKGTLYCGNDCYNKNRRQKRHKANEGKRKKEVNKKYYLKTKYKLTEKYKIEQKKKEERKKYIGRKWQLDNKEKHVEYRRRTKDKIKGWYYKYKKILKCEICGYNKCFEALDFHHKNEQEKEFGIAQSLNKCGKEKILEEIKKCQVLCANCHREVHFKEKHKKTFKVREAYLRVINKPKKIWYVLVEEELKKEWVKELQNKAKYNLNRFGGNQYTRIDNEIEEKIDVKKIIAKKIGIGQKTVCRIIQLYKRGTEEQKQKVRSGEESINKVYKELKPIRYSKRTG